MRTKEELGVLRERAVALRLEGKSLREIKQLLGPMSNTTLHDALRDTPPPAWTRRPNAKDDIRAQARELRTQGLAYHEIADRLGVSKSSVSLWVRDLPSPPRLSYAENRRRSAEGVRRYWAKEREVREVLRAGEVAAAAADIGDLTEREILVAGAIAYWCEGAKRRLPYNFDRVVFMNSDPRLILFFLRFLATAGVQPNDLAFCVHIHETADVEAAQRFWQEITGALPSQFKKPTLKRHNPRTNRKNVGDSYHGCLRVSVYRSSALYRKIEGWASAAMASNLRAQAWGETRTDFLLPGKDSNLRITDQNRKSCLARRPGIAAFTLQGTGPQAAKPSTLPAVPHTPLPAGQKTAGVAGHRSGGQAGRFLRVVSESETRQSLC